MNKTTPPEGYDENPEWTDETTRRARPAGEVHPREVAAALVKRRPGRPPGSAKERIAVRLERDAIDNWRGEGPGWQTRMNQTLDMIAEVQAELQREAATADASGDAKEAGRLRFAASVLRGNNPVPTKDVIRNLALYVATLRYP